MSNVTTFPATVPQSEKNETISSKKFGFLTRLRFHPRYFLSNKKFDRFFVFVKKIKRHFFERTTPRASHQRLRKLQPGTVATCCKPCSGAYVVWLKTSLSLGQGRTLTI